MGRDNLAVMQNDVPKQLSERVRASEARKIKAGGRRIPGGVMPKDAADALDSLQASGYGSSASACIYRALLEADMREKQRR